MVFPQPDSPTRPRLFAAFKLEGDAVDGVDEAGGLAEQVPGDGERA